LAEKYLSVRVSPMGNLETQMKCRRFEARQNSISDIPKWKR
jgi:hypothetical protein